MTSEAAEDLIDRTAPELVATVIESLRAEHAGELGQAEQPAHDVIERLLRKLAITEIRANFESIYARIYGSQVAALQTLREAPNGAQKASVEAHLAQVKHDVNMRVVVWLESLSFDGSDTCSSRVSLRSAPTSATTSPAWAPAFSRTSTGSAT